VFVGEERWERLLCVTLGDTVHSGSETDRMNTVSSRVISSALRHDWTQPDNGGADRQSVAVSCIGWKFIFVAFFFF